MRSLILIAAFSLALGGCSTLAKEKPPICDGKHRRPANPYGSVLDPTAPPATAPAAATAPDKLSAAEPLHASCRA